MHNIKYDIIFKLLSQTKGFFIIFIYSNAVSYAKQYFYNLYRKNEKDKLK